MGISIQKNDLLLAIFLLFPGIVSGTNGYFSHAYGTHAKAMAGAGTALPLSSLISSSNPAGLVWLGSRLDVGLALFSPNRQYQVTGTPSGFPGTFGLAPATVESETSSFLIPSAAVNIRFAPGFAAGVAVYGNGGMNTDYDFPVFGSEPTGVNLAQVFLGATLAKKVSQNHAIGLMGIVAYQTFSAKGLHAFSDFSGDPAHLSDKGTSGSSGLGFRIGYMGRFLNVVFVGASFQSRIVMGAFEKYRGLFAQQGDFDIPPAFTIGIAVKATPGISLAADVQKIYYSEINSVGNPMLPNLLNTRLGDNDAAGFGWDDMTVYKFGAEFALFPGMAVRAGYSYGKQPIPRSEVLFNILAPGVVQQHLSFGFSKSITPEVQLNGAVTRAFSHTLTGDNPLEAPQRQTIELKMDQWEFEIGTSVRF